MFETAIRSGEVADLRLDDVDLISRLATIRSGKGWQQWKRADSTCATCDPTIQRRRANGRSVKRGHVVVDQHCVRVAALVAGADVDGGADELGDGVQETVMCLGGDRVRGHNVQ
jgi:hypothetical protein